MYLQDNNFFRVCQVRDEDIDKSYVALYIKEYNISESFENYSFVA